MILFTTDKNYEDFMPFIDKHSMDDLDRIHFDSYYDHTDQILFVKNRQFASIPFGIVTITFRYVCNSIHARFEVTKGFVLAPEDAEMFGSILVEGKRIVEKVDISARKFHFGKTTKGE
jgi:hypothetical protein